MLRTLFYVALFLVAIVAANLSVAHFGPSAAFVNAFLFIGLDLTCRDRLHDAGRLPMAGAIVAGALLSYWLNRAAGPIAVASVVAFSAAAVADALVYQLRRRAEWFQRANESNLVGAAVDSVVFPALAFPGPLAFAIVFGQFTAKVAGGFVWSLVLRHRQAVAA